MLETSSVNWRERRWLWLIVATFAFAVLSGGSLPYFLFYALCSTAILSWFWTRSALRHVHVTYEVLPEQLTAGQPFQIRIRLHNKRLWLIPWLHVFDPSPLPGDFGADRLTSLGPLQCTVLERHLTANRRGLYSLGALKLRSGDPFGFCEMSATYALRRTLLVQPRLVRLTHLDLPLVQPFGARQTRHSLAEDMTTPAPHRPFQPGDSLRRIHWKATARHRELFTREFEPGVTVEVQIFLDLCRHNYANWPDADERAAELTASVAEYALAQGVSVSLTTHAQKRLHLSGRRGLEQMPQILNLLAQAQPYGEISPAAALAAEAHLYQQATVLVVITPDTSSALGGTLLRLRRRTRPVLLLSLTQETDVSPWHASLLAHGITVRPVTGPDSLEVGQWASPEHA